MDDEAAMERYRIDRGGRWVRADEVAGRLTEEQERDLDEMAKRFERTKGGK